MNLSNQAKKIIFEKLSDLEAAHDLIFNTSADIWLEVEKYCLEKELLYASELEYFQEKNVPSDIEISSDPQKSALQFPIMSKSEYLEHGKELVHEGVGVHQMLYTSGTTTGNRNEIPWDEWAYQKDLIEIILHAYALTGVTANDVGLSLVSSTGSLGGYIYEVAKRINQKVIFPDLNNVFTKKGIKELYGQMRSEKTTFILGASGVLYSITEQMISEGLDPKELGIKYIFSGMGNFLSRRHINYFVKTWDPLIIAEGAGKNEIISSFSGIRYNKVNPSKICIDGLIHYSPNTAYVTTIDSKLFSQNKIKEKGINEHGILMMSRLASGKRGVVSYINDVCDYGHVYKFKKGEKCSCGSSQPMFGFLGRIDNAPFLKFGANLYPAEYTLALNDASKDIGLRPEISAGLKVQVILVRNSDEAKYDKIYWIIGAPLNKASDEDLQKLERLVIDFPKYNYRLDKFVNQDIQLIKGGKGYLIDSKLLPHSGRDKPTYEVTKELSLENEDFDSTVESYISSLPVKK